MSSERAERSRKRGASISVHIGETGYASDQREEPVGF